MGKQFDNPKYYLEIRACLECTSFIRISNDSCCLSGIHYVPGADLRALHMVALIS